MIKHKVLLALPAAAALALAGCGGGDDVATLGGKGQGGAQSQADAARSMVKCLQEAGIPAEYMEWDATQGDFSLDTTEGYAIGYEDGSGTSYPGDVALETEQDWERAMAPINELVAKYDPSVLATSVDGGVSYSSDGGLVVTVTEGDASAVPAEDLAEQPSEDPDAELAEIEQAPPYMIIGDQDHTEAFTKCIEQTGYTQPTYEANPEEELRSKQLSLEAIERWLTCARDNGYPDLKDPPAAKADDWTTMPTALLPVDITEPELRALLEACPNFDEEDMAAGMKEMEAIEQQGLGYSDVMKLYEELTAKYPGIVSPEIGFDAPGFNGDWSNGGGLTETEVDSAEYERLAKLQEILYEKMNAFYESQANASQATEAG
ncbi:MAG: hypothetical protein LBD90_05665 [Bifidobacteriaceae bacterium]|jgi:hypothetical protein|nr:hypothetical protein [Bifidobacteriaceae bacterium]